MGITFSGLARFEARMNTIQRRVERNIDASLKRSTEQTFVDALEITPIDTGMLRATAAIGKVPRGYEIRFRAPYALYVHENMNVIHPIHADHNCQGQAKFLFLALLKNLAEVHKNLQRDMLK